MSSVTPLPVPGSTPASDQVHFAEIYPELRRFAAVVRNAGTDPDDLVQDALVRAMNAGGLSRLDFPVAYLRQTILHLAMDERRRFGRRRRALDRLVVHDAASEQYPSDLGDLDRLEPTDRAVLYLTHVEGLPQAEVADLLGLTHQAVRTRASRARRRLRTALEEGTP